MERRPRLVLRVIGGLAAGHDEACARPIAFSTRKVGALLSVLALSPNQSATREHLATLLWGSRSDSQARQSLRQALVMLRKDVRPSEIVEANADTVQLKPGTVWVDALELETLAASGSFDALTRAIGLVRGELLGGLVIKEESFEAWVHQQRRRFEAKSCEVLERYAAGADALGRGEDAIAAAERLLSLDPLREDWQRLALQLYARHRGRSEALAQADAFAEILWQELSVAPEEPTQQLIEQIRQGSLSRPVAPPNDPPRGAPLAAPRRLSPGPGLAAQAAPPIASRWLALSAAVVSRVVSRSWTPPWPRLAAALAATAALVGFLLVMNGQPFTTARSLTDVSTRKPAPVSEPLRRIRAPEAATARSERGVVAIVVLPFTSNGSGNEVQDSDASASVAGLLTDELTTTLASVGAIRVISRETAKTFRGQTVDATKVGAELGVAYLLEGSASMRGSNLRVNIGLVETATGTRIWSRRFDRTGHDTGHDRLAILDGIINGLCRELQIEVTRIASERGSRAADVHTDVLQGWSRIYATGIQGKPALDDAKTLFTDALDRDPGNTRAQLGLAAYHVNMAVQMFAANPSAHLDEAEALLDSLIKRRPHMGSAHGYVGVAQFARGRLQEARRAFERAIEFSPSNAPAYAQLGRVLLRLGHREEALEHIHYAIRLSPRDPHLAYWLGFAGAAELELEHFDKAITYFSRAVTLNPKQPRNLVALAAAQTLAGNLEAGRETLAYLRRDQPHLSREALLERYANKGPHSAQINRGLGLLLAQMPQSTASASIPHP